jgi:hypothetical protein
VFDHPITLFLYVFSNLTIALACFCVAALITPRSKVTGKVARVGARMFFVALGLLMIDVTMLALFSELDPKSIEWAWHAMILRVTSAIGAAVFAGGLYVDATHWRLPLYTPWRARRALAERERARRNAGMPPT